jgi:hypothetical protein
MVLINICGFFINVELRSKVWLYHLRTLCSIFLFTFHCFMHMFVSPRIMLHYNTMILFYYFFDPFDSLNLCCSPILWHIRTPSFHLSVHSLTPYKHGRLERAHFQYLPFILFLSWIQAFKYTSSQISFPYADSKRQEISDEHMSIWFALFIFQIFLVINLTNGCIRKVGLWFGMFTFTSKFI